MATSERTLRAWGRRFLLPAIVLMAILLTLRAVEEPADATTPLTMEAETMSGAGMVFRDRTASNDRARLLNKNGSVSKEFTGSVNSITVRARGDDSCRGAPRMMAYLDGVLRLSSSVRAGRRWVNYSASVQVPSGNHSVKVAFTNDRATRDCARNLHVDKVSFAVSNTTLPPTTDPSVVKPTCSASLQALVDEATPAAVVEIPGDCIYRETVTINKPLTLRGGPGAEIRGSDVWASSEFTLTGGLYKSTTAVPTLDADTHALCEGSSDGCHQPEQVYLDGVALKQVANTATPLSGEFKIDSNRNLYLADDPSAKVVEVTTRNTWINGTGESVTIDDIVFKHAAADGIKPRGDNWRVEDSDLSYAHQANLRMSQGIGYVAQRNKLHHGGQMGMGGNNSSVQVLSNDVYANNIEEYKHSWAAGGMKLSNGKTLVVDGNHFHHNHGNGVWTDVPNSPQDITVSNNRVDHNEDHGIRFEVSTNGNIYGNTVWENGWLGGGYGISLNASSGARVHHNAVAWNEGGIRVSNPLRTDAHPDEEAYNTVNDVEVDHNDILQEELADSFALGWVVPGTNPYANLYDPSAGNRGHDNRYWYPEPEGSAERYKWDDGFKWLVPFNETLGEKQGRHLSKAEKDQVVVAKGISANPEEH
jgi:parallel beta-helix repeat protein